MLIPRNHENWLSPRRSILAVAVIMCVALLTSAATPAQAQTYNFSVVYTFAGNPDGASPSAGVTLDGKGNLYGTTTYGGFGGGTVFKINSAGTETVLHSFCSQPDCPDGTTPYGGLILDAEGNLYGTTGGGGANQNKGPYGAGTVFEVSNAGTESVLYSFCSKTNCTDGADPESTLVMDAQGDLYGTTYSGGANSQGCERTPCGTIFKLAAKKDTLDRLYSFNPKSGGGQPRSGLVRDSAGNLYGTAPQELGALGIIYREALVDGKWTNTTLYSFSEASGSIPYAPLIIDGQGNLYGTTNSGGTYKAGTVFKLDTSGNLTTLYSFGATSGDARYPMLAGLVMDGQGNIYGTTSAGGDTSCNAPDGCGAVFKLDTNNNETVLYSFTGGTDGSFPAAGLALDSQGNLYGTTFNGGLNTCSNGVSGKGCGVVFKLTPQ
jgi:uncharacterized repeat protein (TIGR03803 family)